MSKKIVIYSSDTKESIDTEKILREKLRKENFTVLSEIEEDVELIICIGGDGTFLQAVHRFDFPNIPFIGINTGHLGFFQEIMPDKVEEFIDNYREGRYRLQNMQAVRCNIKSGNTSESFTGLNEIVVRGSENYSVHLNISIGGGFIEKFSGDGILISTPAGSTAYNYSLGGSIVDPRLELLQVTPIAPMNTTAYRSFMSSILLPPDLSLGIVPDGVNKGGFLITYDGFGKVFDHVDSVDVKLSDIAVSLLRFETYDFWDKVKTKFL